MPYEGFGTTSLNVGGTVSTIFVVHPAPLMRLGIVSALRVLAGRCNAALVQGSGLSDIATVLRQAQHGDTLLCDVSTWSSLEKDTTGLQEHVRSRRIAICLVACTDAGAHRLLQLRGVAGVVSADCEPDELEAAVDSIRETGSYFKTEVRTAPATGMAKLSSRQIEILELMTRGLLNKQIAWELGVTEGTVKSHVSAILEKLGCDRRTQAITAFLQSLGVGHSGAHRSLHS